MNVFGKSCVYLTIFLEIYYIKICKADLLLVHAIFRHGDRTTIKESIYPNDPYKNISYFPYGHGALTNEGKRREHQLGSILRKRYHHFLDNLYTPDIVDARCSDFSRTKMSLELVLAALFPPRGTLEQWLPGLNWQPVPYNFERVTSDKLFFGNMVCPNYKKSYEKYMNTEEGRALINKYSKIFYYLSENTGWNITDFVLVFLLYDTLKTESEWGLPLPKWTEKVYPQILKEMASKEYWILSATTKMKQINSGHLLKKIIIDTLSKINGTLNQKLYLYSGHDFNIASLLIALGIFKQHIPPYGSCILIEVHRIRGQYGVKIVYLNYQHIQTGLLKMQDCEWFCPLDKFISLAEKFFLSDDVCGL